MNTQDRKYDLIGWALGIIILLSILVSANR